MGSPYAPSSPYNGCVVGCPEFMIHNGDQVSGIPDSFVTLSNLPISEVCCNELNGFYIDNTCYTCPPATEIIQVGPNLAYNTIPPIYLSQTCCTWLAGVDGFDTVYWVVGAMGGCVKP